MIDPSEIHRVIMNLIPFQSHRPQLNDGVYIAAASCVIGQVSLGQDASVWPFASIRGDLLPIEIGQGSNVQDHACLHTTAPNEIAPEGFALSIGNQVTIGHHATLHGCQIGNRVLIGIGAIVLDGVVVEDDVLIGAGCVVPPGKTLKSGFVYIGNPMKELRPIKDIERRHILHNAKSYVDQKNRYLKERP